MKDPRVKPPALDPTIVPHFVNSSYVLDIGEHSGKQVYALPSPSLCLVLRSLESPLSEEAAGGTRSGDPHPEPGPQGPPRQLRNQHFHSAFHPIGLIFMSFPPVHSFSPECPSPSLQCQPGLSQPSESTSEALEVQGDQ